MRRTYLLIIAAAFSPWFAMGETADQAIVRATDAMQAATARAQADPSHPIFHVASPAQWMNDPNGPIFYKGYYHLFYQLHPFSDRDGTKYWGHVRSRDLVKWEHLPIAVAPSNEQGEAAIWSGCCTVNGLGQPMIFYTSIGQGKSAFDQAAQWAAIGDDTDLIHWHKCPANPVLSDVNNEGTKIYDWRDPFIFNAGKQTFLVTGGHLAREHHAAVSIYEAENKELTQWKFRGPLFQHPDPDAPTVECPNFFQLGKQWVLFVSPYGHVQYFTGDFDASTYRFTSSQRGLLDYGTFYAPNTMQLPDGRRLVWGWVNGFPDGHGWNGCLTLPRQLSVARDGHLLQSPAPQLTRLRGKVMEWRRVKLAAGGTRIELPKTNALEIEIDAELGSAEQVVFEIGGRATGQKPVTLAYDGAQLTVLDTKAPLKGSDDSGKLHLQIFIDRSVLEVYANDDACVTRVIPTLDANSALSVRAEGGEAKVKTVQAWPMQGIW
jgi:beta-fructofuranosidase